MIPKPLLNEILADEFYKKCVRFREKSCGGRVTYEHAVQYASRQLNEKWAIIPLCEKHHGVLQYQDRGDLNKELNMYYAIIRATDKDLAKYPKRDWIQLKRYLIGKYAGK